MATSRFNNAEKIVYDDEIIYEEREPLEMEDNNETDRFYLVKDGDTWRGIAFELYGEARYYWILVSVNKAIDPFDVPEPGLMIRYPTLRRIQAAGY